ncbi:MAG: LysR family transcriptional regulator [Pseudomonadota bacterium]
MRGLDWDHLRVFLATAQAGSLRRAAAELGVGHATVRRAIDRLEDQLDTRLFDRSADGLTPTQPGDMLIDHARRVEQETNRIARRLSGLDAAPSGTIRVSMPPSFAQGFFAPILAEFTQAYPNISVSVIGTNRISDLTRLEADVSIRAAFEIDDDVVGRRLVRYVTAAFATPDYLASRPRLKIGDGAEAHWLGFGGDTDWVASSPFPNAPTRHMLPEVFMQIEAAAHGLGMAWVPAFLGDLDPRLIRVPDAPVEPNRSIWLLLHGDLRGTARVRAFVDHTAASIARNKSKFTL